MVPEEPQGKDSKPDGKSDARRSDHIDPFVAHSIFPDASAVFTCRPGPLAEAKDTACIVLDTNALLVPYGIGIQTLSEIEATYQRLLQENRLVIPAQVAREFARNRVGKLVELYQRLSQRRSRLQPFQQGSYPLLENFQEYQRLREVENELDRLISEYQQLLKSVINHVHSWEWNDPVSLLYGKLFRTDVVVDTTKPLEEIGQEHRRRFANKIPPGYKDIAKDDQGIGDLLIWLTILEIGCVRRTSVIFVSGEEKADWWHRSEQQQLYPRFELVDEFRRVSGGGSFHIIKFSRLLELFGASSEVVAEVREEERIAAPQVPLTRHRQIQLRGVQAEQSVAAWLTESGYEVSPAPHLSGYDYVVEGPEGDFAVDIMYVHHSSRMTNRLMQRRFMRHNTVSDLPLTVVVVAETPIVLQQIEGLWEKYNNASFRLCTGLLTSDGQFQPDHPL